MNDLFQSAIKQNFPETHEHNEQTRQILKIFNYWTPQDWRQHYDKLEYNNFKVLPKGLIFSKLFADIKPPAQSTLTFALAQLWFTNRHTDKRHNNNRPTITPIVSNVFTLPLAALQAIGIGSKNTCAKTIKTLIKHNIIVKHKNNQVGKPNTYSFTKYFINTYIYV